MNPEKESVKKRILAKARATTKAPRKCKACGQPGHRSDTCPTKNGRGASNKPELTQEQMDYIKELAEQGKSIAEIVIETGLPSQVVKENMY